MSQQNLVERFGWDNVVLVVRDGTVDATWDGKVKNLVYNTDTMAWEAMTPSTGSGGVASSVSVSNFPASYNTYRQNALVTVAYDAVVPTFNASSDVWAYKTGGTSGTTVATVTVTYTDSTKATIQSVVRS